MLGAVATFMMVAQTSVAPQAVAVAGIPEPFALGAQQILVSQGTGGGNNNLYTNWYTTVQNPDGSTSMPLFDANALLSPQDTQMINALGFDTLDRFVYGIGLSNANVAQGAGTNQLIRVGTNAMGTQIVTQNLGGVKSLPQPSDSYNAGTMGDNSAMCGVVTCAEILFVKQSNNGLRTIYLIDIPTMSVVKALTLTQPITNTADMFFSQGFLWAFMGNNTGTGGRQAPPTVYRIDPNSGQTDIFQLDIPEVIYQSYGAQWSYGNGNFGILGNTSGTIYQIEIENPSTTPIFTLIASTETGLSTTKSDGTAIVGQPVDLGLTKTVSPENYEPGDTLTYTLTVTNHGGGESSGWSLNDTLPSLPDPSAAVPDDPGCTVENDHMRCNGGSLAPGESYTITYSYPGSATGTLTGDVVDTATVIGNEQDDDLSNNVASAVAHPVALSLVKTDDRQTVTSLNDPINFSFKLTNNGTVDMQDVAVQDAMLTAAGVSVSCPSTSLAAGATMTCTALYLVTQADLDAGKIVNLATATASEPGGIHVETPQASLTVWVSDVEVAKTASPMVVHQAGDVITYEFLVTNSGNSVLNDLTLHDPMLDVFQIPENCPKTTLVPAESMICTAEYTVRPADIAAKSITNTVTVSGTDSSGNEVGVPPSTVTVGVAALSLDKSSNRLMVSEAGDQITYFFDVVNTGAVPLTLVTVNDAMLTAAGAPVQCPATTLYPGARETCTARYVTTDADIAAGRVDNTATVSGMDPLGGLTTSTASSQTVLVSSISVVKTADRPSVMEAGDQVGYTFDVTNTGQTPLTLVSVDDPMLAAAGVTPSCPADSLAVGESMTCTATYTVQPADMLATQIVNTATASGQDPTREVVVSDPSTATVDTSAISVVKTADRVAVSDAGDHVDFTFTVTNTGSVPLTVVTIIDPSLASVASIVHCPKTTLDPGEMIVCTATYIVTDDDIASGQVVNTATATGVDPWGTTVTSPESTMTEYVSPLEVIKTADPPSVSMAGDIITYSFLVTNRSHETLTGISVSDSTLTDSGTVIDCPSDTLVPDESMTCTAEYTVSATDLIANKVINTATATGVDSASDTVTSPVSTASTPVSSIAVEKTSDRATVTQAGDQVTFSFHVENTGDTPLTQVAVSDGMLTDALAPISCPATVLVSGASMVCTGVYPATPDDIAAGQIVNIVTASGVDPFGRVATSAPSTATVLVASLSVVKVADRQTVTKAGDVIHFTFEVHNTGHVPVENITVFDPVLASEGVVAACPQQALDVTEGMTCVADYTVTSADIASGMVTNTATAIGTDAGGDFVTSGASTALVWVTSVSLTKTAAPQVAQVGDTVTYTFTVKNTGRVSLSGVSIDDPSLATAPTCPTGALAPGASVVCTATYTVLASDLAAGEIDNTATASALDTYGTTVTSPTASAHVGIEGLSLAKTADTQVVRIGDTVTYSFDVTNDTSVVLDDLVIHDPLLGTIQPSCPVTTLQPGESTTCAATFTVTAANTTTGQVKNTATATATGPDGASVTSPEADAIVDVASITASKTADPLTVTRVGEALRYSIEVTNTGSIALSSVSVSDPMLEAAHVTVSCPSTSLAPGASMTCVGDYTVTQADITAQEVTNTATAQGTTSGGIDVVSEPSTVTTTVSDLQVVKLADTHTVSAVGDVIGYGFTITNVGTGPLSDIAVQDPMLDAAHAPVTCPLTVLSAGESMVCTAQYTVTSADIAAGHVANTATAVATHLAGDQITSDSSTVTVPVSGLGLVKTVTPTVLTQVGQTVRFSFAVSNTGAVPLTDVSIVDPMLDAAQVSVSCPTTALAAGESMTCTAQHTLTQADLNAGPLGNTATVHGTDPWSDPVTSPQASARADVAAVTIQKTVDPSIIARVGQMVSYSFDVRNIGSLPLSDVSVADPMLDAAHVSVACPSDALAPSASMTCAAQYTVTAQDLAAGALTNSATATAQDPSGTTITSDESTATVDVAGLRLVKSADKTSVSHEGDVIAYTFDVTNTGDAALTDVGIVDPLLTAYHETVTCPSTALDAGQSMTCAATHTVSTSDLLVGKVVNTATAIGDDSNGDQVSSDTSMVTTDIVDITLVKTADHATVNTVGDILRYTFQVANPGDLPLTAVTVSDPMLEAAGVAVACPSTSLGAGATMTCSASYTVTQTDLDTGSVVNTATASAVGPSQQDVSSQPSTVSTPVSDLDLVKSADRTTVSAVGDLIGYSFVITNTGTSDLSDVTVVDPSLGSVQDQITCPRTALSPGQSVTCSATYAVTQTDIAAGQVVNTATAHGTNLSGATITSEESSTRVGVSGISVAKTVDPPTMSYVGQHVTYSFAVTNTGGEPLTHVAVDDAMLMAAGVGVTCPISALSPGASTVCTAIYAVTQADLDSAPLTNSATVQGTDPSGRDVTSRPSTATVVRTGLTVLKTADPPTVQHLGDVVDYSFAVTNSGGEALTGVAVQDPLLDAAGVSVSCPGTVLSAGASMTCTAASTVGSADVAAGAVVNTATATGTDPRGHSVTSPPSTVTVPVVSLSLVKTADRPSVTRAGDHIGYSFQVTNTSGVTITGTHVVDPALDSAGVTVECPLTTLTSHQSMTCTADTTVTDADIVAGQATNTASVHGNDPTGETVTSESSTVTVPVASMTLDKTANRHTVMSVGDHVTYSLAVTNTGGVALHSVTVSDPLLAAAGDPISCPATAVDPGQTLTCTATYTVTRADIDAGRIQNTAIATGVDPTGAHVTTPGSTATVWVSSLDLTKTASTASVRSVGDQVSYSFLVANDGAGPVTNVTITDPMLASAHAAISCPATSLAAGESMTCTATYAVTGADVVARHVTNTASASGVDSAGAVVSSNPDTATVSVSGLVLAKTADRTWISKAGDVIGYSFLVTNTGSSALTGVAVQDPMLSAAHTDILCPATTVLPGQSMTCTAQYTVTQADVSAPRLTNTATVSGVDSSGTTIISDTSVAEVGVSRIELTKTADQITVIDAGDQIVYSFQVVNAGGTPLSDVTVIDPLFPSTTPVTCPATSLAAGASMTCTATYDATAADIANGGIENTATASGQNPQGQTVTSAPSTVDVGVPRLEVRVTADPRTVAAAGDEVEYSFEVSNTGSTPMLDIWVSEPMLDRAHVPITCPQTTLDPGESMTCTADYEVTQDDIDQQHVPTVATAHGLDPSGRSVVSPESEVVVDVVQLDAVKTADKASVSRAGETITYSVLVTNRGTGTLTGVVASDPMLDQVHEGLSCPATTLGPQQSMTCTGVYTVTQEDIDAGHVVNSARVSGTTETGVLETSAATSVTVGVDAAPNLTLVKSGLHGAVTVGGSIAYTFILTNTGNVTLTNLHLNEMVFTGAGKLADVQDAACVTGAGTTAQTVTLSDVRLGPQESVVCTLPDYTIVSADAVTGSISNTADATATTTPTDSGTTVTVTSSPSLSQTFLSGVPSIPTGGSVAPPPVHASPYWGPPAARLDPSRRWAGLMRRRWTM